MESITADKPVSTESAQANCLVKQQAVFTDADAGHVFAVSSAPDSTYRQGASGVKTDIENSSQDLSSLRVLFGMRATPLLLPSTLGQHTSTMPLFCVKSRTMLACVVS
jgi:hypothetical protein